MSLAKRGFSAAVYSYIAEMATKVLNFLSAFFVISLLTVEEYGIYNLFLSLVLIFSSLGFGVPKMINRYYPEYEQKEEWYILKKLLQYSILLRGLTIATLSIILYMFKESFLSTFNIPDSYSESIYFFCIYVFVYSLSHTFECILLSQLQYKFHKSVQLILHIFKICLIYYVLTNGYGIPGIVLIWLLTSFITLFVYSFKSYYRISDKIRNAKKKVSFPFKRISRYGGLYFASTLGALFLHYSIDIFFISYYSGNIDSGLYAFGVKISMLALTLSPAFVLQGIFTNLLIRSGSKNGNHRNLESKVRTYYKILLLFTPPIVILTGLYADKVIVYIFKEGYLDSLFIVYGFLFFTIFRIIDTPLHPIIKIIEKPEIEFGLLSMSLLKIFLNIIFIPVYGIYGALLSTGITMVFSSCYLILMLRKNIDLSFPWRSSIKFGINAVGLFLVGFLLKAFISSLITLLLCSIFSIVSYVILCYFNKGFSNNERQIFNKAMGRDIFVF